MALTQIPSGMIAPAQTLSLNGVTFPATQAPSADANTLDDYEEGTWTPTISGSSSAGTGTYTIQVGRYTKIGNLVTANCYIGWSAHTGTGNLRLSNLPFTTLNVTNTYVSATIGYWSNIALNANNVPVGYSEPNTTLITFDQYQTGGSTAASVAMDTAGALMISISYQV